MSPFNYAHQIRSPLLLIHGAADNNTGTHTVQSERLFQAIQGSLLPHLAALEPASAEFRGAVRTTVVWIVGFAGLCGLTRVGEQRRCCSCRISVPTIATKVSHALAPEPTRGRRHCCGDPDG